MTNNDKIARQQAEQYISQYQRAVGVSFKNALNFAATDDVGPIIWRGIDILRQEHGLTPLRRRNPDT